MISLRATVPGLKRLFLASLTPPSAGAVFLFSLTLAIFEDGLDADEIFFDFYESLAGLARALVVSILAAVVFCLGIVEDWKLGFLKFIFD